MFKPWKNQKIVGIGTLIDNLFKLDWTQNLSITFLSFMNVMLILCY